MGDKIYSASGVVEHVAAAFLAATGLRLVNVSGMVFTRNEDDTLTIALTDKSSITISTTVVNDGG